MIYFLYGEDSYRAKEKLQEIIDGYKKVHKSGLNLIYIDAEEKDFNDFYSNFKITSMFAEKKLVVLKNIFSNEKFCNDFLENIKRLEEIRDIIAICETEKIDQRDKLFKALKKSAKCQEFCLLKGMMLKKWIRQELDRLGVKITPDAEDLLFQFADDNLWQTANSIKKLADYKGGAVIKKEDIELHIRPKIENEIFKTIDALASKNKKQALRLLHNHFESGDNALYLLSMVAYQFKNLLIIKEMMEKHLPYQTIVKKSGLHPFVVQKTYYLCGHFSMADLKKIYQKIFQADLDIKAGRIEPETALDLLVSFIN